MPFDETWSILFSESASAAPPTRNQWDGWQGKAVA
jgi:hypothetical protein